MYCEYHPRILDLPERRLFASYPHTLPVHPPPHLSEPHLHEPPLRLPKPRPPEPHLHEPPSPESLLRTSTLCKSTCDNLEVLNDKTHQSECSIGFNKLSCLWNTESGNSTTEINNGCNQPGAMQAKVPPYGTIPSPFSSTVSGYFCVNSDMYAFCDVLMNYIHWSSMYVAVKVSNESHFSQTCFVLGDVHTLPITHQGGTFPLRPFGPCGGEQQVECCATLEAPPGVVGSGVTVSVHYAIILDGPFKFPEKWERTSVVLYIDCPEKRLLIKSFKVDLHHWVVSSETFRMCFLKSDHLLQYRQTKFTFRFHANAIPSQPNVASVYLKDHFCLVCVAAQSDVMVTSRYYGILLSDPLEERVQRFWLCITYALPSWVQVSTEVM